MWKQWVKLSVLNSEEKDIIYTCGENWLGRTEKSPIVCTLSVTTSTYLVLLLSNVILYCCCILCDLMYMYIWSLGVLTVKSSVESIDRFLCTGTTLCKFWWSIQTDVQIKQSGGWPTPDQSVLYKSVNHSVLISQTPLGYIFINLHTFSIFQTKYLLIWD